MIKFTKIIFAGIAVAVISACTSMEKSSTAFSPSENGVRLPSSVYKISGDFRSKTLKGVADALRVGQCPELSRAKVAGPNGDLMESWQVIAELYSQSSDYDQRNLSETLAKMVEGSPSSIEELPPNPTSLKYQRALNPLGVRGPASYFVLKNANKEIVLRFGPYSNGAIACNAVD